MNTMAFNLEPSVPFSDIKTSIIEKIWNLDSVNLLSKINDLLSKSPKKEQDLKPYTMEEINQMIDESLDDIKNGRVYTTEQVDNLMKEKYPWLR